MHCRTRPPIRMLPQEHVPQSIEDFITANLPLSGVPFVPEISIHKAVPYSRIGRLAERDANFTSPYWAHYWCGGLALARHILDEPHRVRGRRVLDLGTGSGIVAIAAARSGAREVTAADIDPYAIAAASLNARANGVTLRTCFADLTREGSPPRWDVVTVGDLFYEAGTAKRVEAFLRSCAASGVEVLVGDPGRAYLPRESLELITTFLLSEATGAACRNGKRTGVFALKR